MITIFTFIFFILGLIIGSFLNVVIIRLNTGKTFGGRSMCMSCHKKLSWIELIPLFSYLFLLGRCKKCKAGISVQYPLIETLTGFVFALTFLKLQNLFFFDPLIFSFTYSYYVALFALLIVISVYDIKHKIIPDELSLIFGVLAFIGLFFFQDHVFMPHMPTAFEFAAGLVVAFPFALLWLVSQGRWMGLGDAKLALGLGWLLGLYPAITALVFSFWIGAVAGVGLLIFSKKYRFKSEIPFGPYLALATLLVFFFDLHLF
jgi:prepilin signal peptidase PulO-like enzyme (type II secretory pathway)